MNVRFIYVWFSLTLLLTQRQYLDCSISSSSTSRFSFQTKGHSQNVLDSGSQLKLRGGSAIINRKFDRSDISDNDVFEGSKFGEDDSGNFPRESNQVSFMSTEEADADVVIGRANGEIIEASHDTYFQRVDDALAVESNSSTADAKSTPRTRTKRRPKAKRTAAASKTAQQPARSGDDGGAFANDEDSGGEFSWGLSSDPGGGAELTAIERLAERVLEKTGSPVFRLESDGVLKVPRCAAGPRAVLWPKSAAASTKNLSNTSTMRNNQGCRKQICHTQQNRSAHFQRSRPTTSRPARRGFLLGPPGAGRRCRKLDSAAQSRARPSMRPEARARAPTRTRRLHAWMRARARAHARTRARAHTHK